MSRVLKLKGIFKEKSYIRKRPTRKVKENVIYQGDNLEIMRSLEGSKIDLIYIDPPFCSQSVRKSKTWKKPVQFNDGWKGGINSYIRWLIPRLRECHRLLKRNGVFCLHLDWRSCHYAKIEIDKIFGYNNFINEIIWRRDVAGKGAKNTSRQFPKNHDTILVYSKSEVFKFHSVKTDLDDKQKKCYRHVEKRTGRRFKSVQLGDYSKKSIIEMKKNNLIYVSKTGKEYKKYYLDEASNTIGSIWTDILGFGTKTNSTERLGYPTQKPINLLKRLITAFTDKNDIVADFFCGCGTTISSAQNENRKWIGIDISKDAISVIRERMTKDHNLKVQVIKTDSLSRDQIYGLSPFEFERKMVEMLGGTPNLKQVGDGGVDGYCYDHTPIQVKKSFGVGRPVLDSFYKHVKNGNGKGVIIARSFSNGANEERNRLWNEEGLEIDLIPSDDIIRDAS